MESYDILKYARPILNFFNITLLIILSLAIFAIIVSIIMLKKEKFSKEEARRKLVGYVLIIVVVWSFALVFQIPLF